MKKFSLFIAMLAVAAVSYGQAKVEVGIKGGVNLNRLVSDQGGIDMDSKTGYHFGAYGLVKFAAFGIQPEMLYSFKPAQFSTVVNNAKEDFTQEFVYLDIPVMFKMYTIAGVYLQAGPQFGVLLSADGKIKTDEQQEPQDIDRDAFKSMDMSAAVGAGWDGPFGIRASVRYIIGLTDISSMADQTNRMFQLSVGYKLFKIGN